ncbi:MAG: pyridoxal-phosphate dependent enzyme [Pseudomonadota bacterium]
MKLIPAHGIIEQAVRQGELSPGGTIVEVSSGTFALALAILAKEQGYRLKLVTIDIDPVLHGRLLGLGAEVHVVREPDASGSIQRTQLNILERLREETPDAFWCAQYSNQNNPGSYTLFADYLRTIFDQLDVLVGTIGTGGSMTGTTRSLRRHWSQLEAVAVDSTYSVSFGIDGDGADSVCRHYMDQMLGLGSRVKVPVLDHCQFDQVHWLPFRTMVQGTHELHDEHGLFMGPTSGAAYWVARWIAKNNPDRKVLALLPDTGLRYVSTLFNRDWVRALDISEPYLRADPDWVGDQSAVGNLWAAMPWERRTLEACPIAA